MSFDPAELKRMEDSAVERYIQQCEASGLTPHTDKFIGSLRGLQKVGAEYFTSPGAALHGDHGSFTANPLRVKDALEMHNQRVLTQRTPYATTIVRTGPDRNFDMAVGSFESTWSMMLDEGQRGVNWTIEVQILLSPKQRSRCVKVYVMSPTLKKPDLSVRTVAQHLANMEERTQFTSRVVYMRSALLEEDRRFQSGFYAKAKNLRREMNVTVSGLIRMLQDILTYSDPVEGPVTGNPMFRLHLDQSYGLVLRGKHLHQAESLDFLQSWLWDVVTFTETRDRYWNADKNMYVTSTPLEAPPAIPMEHIYRALRS